MTLDKSALQSDLQSLFEKPPRLESECAHLWAEAMKKFATAVGPPSTQVDLAASTMEGLLAGFAQADQAASLLEGAATKFASVVAAGMALAPTPYLGVPPAGSVGFAAIFLAPTADPAARATALTNAVDTWMKTGTATLTAPPNTSWPPSGKWS